MPQPSKPVTSTQGRSATGKVALTMPSYAPHCASTTPTGYTCPELTRAPARAGASDAFKLPSRSAFTK